MAVDGEEAGDFGAHDRDYSRFIGMVKWGTIIVAIITLFVVINISS